jgi:hypothetical protein
MARRDYALIGAFLVVAAAAAVVLVVVLRDEGGEGLTKAEYIARVNAICSAYNRRLAKIPAPLATANPKAIAQSVERALPLVQERADKAKAIEPPPELAGQVERMFTLSDAAVAELRSARVNASKGQLAASARALGRFLSAGEEAHAAAVAIGLNC